MALWKFSNLNKYGNIRTRITYTPTSQLTIGQGFGPFVGASRFRYESRSPYFGLLNLNGKKYLVPDWIEVHPQTTYDDIKHETPIVVELPKEKNEWLFESSSDPGHFYKVTKVGVTYKCNCPGVWRSKDRRCKHIKEIELKNK